MESHGCACSRGGGRAEEGGALRWAVEGLLLVALPAHMICFNRQPVNVPTHTGSRTKCHIDICPTETKKCGIYLGRCLK